MMHPRLLITVVIFWGTGTASAQPSFQLASLPRAAVLSEPAVLASTSRDPATVEVTLTAAVANVSLAPGSRTDIFAYNGSMPGPTLEVKEGDHVIVHFHNELPEETTVHWHGLHIPFAADGSPFHPVPAGGSYDYEFTVPRGSAGTYWYHPHPHHRTGYQVARGLFGALIVRAADDPIPRGITEKLIILSDNRFLETGALDLPAHDTPEGRRDLENGREGDVIFVNGAVAPRISIRSGEVQRWRVINASAARLSWTR